MAKSKKSADTTAKGPAKKKAVKKAVRKKAVTTPEPSNKDRDLYLIKFPENYDKRKQPHSFSIGSVIKQSGDEVLLTPEEVARYGADYFEKVKK